MTPPQGLFKESLAHPSNCPSEGATEMLEAIHFHLDAWYAVLVEFVYARVEIGDRPGDSP
jgi:hypothetical protein